MRVLRRKRRQPELTTRAALGTLTAQLAAITTGSGQTFAEIRFFSHDLVIDPVAMLAVTLYAWDAGMVQWRSSTADSYTDAYDTDGLEVSLVWNWEADLTKPAQVYFHVPYDGVRTPAGDRLGSIMTGIVGVQCIGAGTSWP